MSTITNLKEDVKKLKELMCNVYERILNDSIEKESVDDEICDLLRVPICLFAKLVVPDIHQKVNEIVYADRNDLTVNKKQHGADLFQTNVETGQRSHVEHKKSRCPRRGRRCNFNWRLPPARLPKEERRKKLLKSISEKTGGPEGHAVLEIVDGMDRLLHSYKLAGSFLLGYFSRIELGKSDNHNMGCARCSRCRKFHRMEKLQLYNNSFIKNGYLTEQEWNQLLTKTKQSCSAS